MIDRVKEIVKEIQAFHIMNQITEEEMVSEKANKSTYIKQKQIYMLDQLALALHDVGDWSVESHNSQFLRGIKMTLDVYAFNRAEIVKIVTNAYAQGLKDAPMQEKDFKG